VKGVGEGGTIAAPPAVVNAVVDALEPLGVDHVDMPLMPDRVWAAMRAAGGADADRATTDAGDGGEGGAG
jgi:carbon-monoxide dehydrogenase large subunit